MESQTQLNWVSGNIYAKSNSPLTAVSLKMNGYYGLDIAPLSTISATLSGNDTGLISDIVTQLLVNEVDRDVAFDRASIVDTITFVQVVDGIPGDTLEIVQQPDLEQTFNPSPFRLSDPFDIPLPAMPTAGDLYVVLHPIDKGLWWTNEVENPSPRWWSMNFTCRS